MANSFDILHIFPDIAAIGQSELHVYCNEWLQRPIARKCGVDQIIIDEQRHMQMLFDRSGAALKSDHALMAAVAVNPIVNNARNEGPDCIEPYAGE